MVRTPTFHAHDCNDCEQAEYGYGLVTPAKQVRSGSAGRYSERCSGLKEGVR